MTTVTESFSFCSHPSHYLEKVRLGETVIVTDAGRQIAELKPLAADPPQPRQRRVFGADAGKMVVPDSFFDPLPADIMEAFEGGLDDPLLQPRPPQKPEEKDG